MYMSPLLTIRSLLFLPYHPQVGLLGRTGSGKSSVFLALFRMVELEQGRMLIDGIDTRLLGVRHLRSRMSIIPQVRGTGCGACKRV